MIATLEGKIEHKGSDHIVVGVGGVGFRVRVPLSTLSGVGDVGDRVKLHTHLHVRENELALYGCETAEELELFELLLTVSGIGPRSALLMLSKLTPEMLSNAIANKNLDVLSTVPGIGKKTAERIVLDLKGKVKVVSEAGAVVPSQVDQDAIAALTALGYSVGEAQTALRYLTPEEQKLSIEEKILTALRYMGG